MSTSIILPPSNYSTLTRGWLLLAISALGIAGCFSILIVLLRTPGLQDYIENKALFKTSLIAHVNLSVLFWMLSIISYLYSLYIHPRYNVISWVALYLCGLATILLSLAAFIPDSQPLMNNYIPVLQNIFFFLGLSCLLCGNGMQLILFTLSCQKSDNLAIYCRLLAAVHYMVYLAFILSYLQLSKMMNIAGAEITPDYYELLFWGGGHLLQFLYSQAMMIAWILLYAQLVVAFQARLIKIIFSILIANTVFTFLALFIYYIYPINTYQHITYFTQHMIAFGGIAPTLLILAIICDYPWQNKLKHNKLSAIILTLSGVLFALGGMVACFIKNIDATIPAHYHGSIVGITLAFTGLVYLSLFDKTSKLALWQSIIYAAGQILHILGLAWSGGYGELRKTTAIAMSVKAQVTMLIMGIGGIIAIIGGGLFVIICLRALSTNHQPPKVTANEYSE